MRAVSQEVESLSSLDALSKTNLLLSAPPKSITSWQSQSLSVLENFRRSGRNFSLLSSSLSTDRTPVPPRPPPRLFPKDAEGSMVLKKDSRAPRDLVLASSTHFKYFFPVLLSE